MVKKVYAERRRRLAQFIRKARSVQIVDDLYDGDCGYCILGLICEHFRRETGRGYWTAEMHGDCLPYSPRRMRWKFVAWNSPWNGYIGSMSSLPDPVAEYYGFSSCDVAVNVDDEDTSFLDLNDTGDFDFYFFARIIEEAGPDVLPNLKGI